MKRKLEIAVFFIAFCAIATLVSLWDDEPEWEGRKVSEWIVELQPYQFSMARDLELDDWEERYDQLVSRNARAKEAIRNIGPVVLPYLLHLLEDEKEPGVVEWWMDLIASKPAGPPDPNEQGLRIARAAAGFAALGDQATTAIPELEKMLFNESTRPPAVRCLRAIGKPAVPVFVAGLHHPDWEIRLACLNALRFARTNAPSALPSIRPLLFDVNEVVRLAAIGTLVAVDTNRGNNLRVLKDILDAGGPGNWGEANAFHSFAIQHRSGDEETEHLIAQLMERARSTNAMVMEHSLHALGTFRAQTKAARQVFIEATSNASGQVRRNACFALGWIGVNEPEVLSALAHLVRTDSDRHIRASALRALAGYGEDAVVAAPDLEKEIRKAMEAERRRKVIESKKLSF